MWTQPRSVAHILAASHYLGSIDRGMAWRDEFGVIVVGPPTSRRIPLNWLELIRWCIVSRDKNAGSQQWAAFVRGVRAARADVTTIVSYSDPSAGHTGALYRACNWWWAPTWHRLRPPPTGNGKWSEGEKAESVKDRWIFPLRKDKARAGVLVATDESVLRAKPWARYREPGGADYRAFIESQNGGDHA